MPISSANPPPSPDDPRRSAAPQGSEAAGPPRSGDLAWMNLALDEARVAFAADEVPIGAVVVSASEDSDESSSPRVLARAHNLTRTNCDPTAHAEILALRQAARQSGYPRLQGCTVYTTVEPCFMCAGALVHARVARVVWAVRDPKFGGCVSLGRVLDHPGANHQVAMFEGVAAAEARALLQQFFRSKR